MAVVREWEYCSHSCALVSVWKVLAHGTSHRPSPSHSLTPHEHLHDWRLSSDRNRQHKRLLRPLTGPCMPVRFASGSGATVLAAKQSRWCLAAASASPRCKGLYMVGHGRASRPLTLRPPFTDPTACQPLRTVRSRPRSLCVAVGWAQGMGRGLTARLQQCACSFVCLGPCTGH